MQPTTLPSGRTETLEQTKQRAKELTSVSADQLTNPPEPVTLQGTPEPTLPDQSRVNNVLGSIRSTSDTARRLQEEQAAFQSFADRSSGFDIQNEQLERFGVTPEKLSRLEDIQLQLSDRAADSAVTQSRIQNAAGQTLNQAQREVTQEQREEAIRSAALASEASVLTGSIEAGRKLAQDAVTIALQDRQFQATAMLNQIADLKEVVGEETRQLLVQEERQYTEEIADINRAKSLVDSAVSSGYLAGQQLSEIVSIKDPVAQAEKVQSIIAQNIQREIAEAKAAEAARAAASATAAAQKPPEMKNFGTSDNPVWKQWNPETASWVDVSGVDGAMAGTDAQDTLAQFSFLTDSANRILGNDDYEPLYKASGKGVWDRAAGFLVGDTKYNRLETQTDTLKTNMLTMMADPNVKKFFGPQMSNNDVKLMSSAATTLRPESQSPAETKAETERILDLVNRAETAVRLGLSGQAATLPANGNYITAPDGTVIEIVD